MVDVQYSALDNKLAIVIDKKKVNCKVVEKPYFDPKKKIASS